MCSFLGVSSPSSCAPLLLSGTFLTRARRLFTFLPLLFLSLEPSLLMPDISSPPSHFSPSLSNLLRPCHSPLAPLSYPSRFSPSLLNLLWPHPLFWCLFTSLPLCSLFSFFLLSLLFLLAPSSLDPFGSSEIPLLFSSSGLFPLVINRSLWKLSDLSFRSLSSLFPLPILTLLATSSSDPCGSSEIPLLFSSSSLLLLVVSQSL